MGVRGKQVRFEFVSADATVAAVVSMFDSNGVALTMGAKQVLSIQSVSMRAAGALVSIILFDDKNADGVVDAGERLWETASTAANDHESAEFPGEGQMGGVGRLPKVQTSAAGAIRLTGMGYLIDA